MIPLKISNKKSSTQNKATQHSTDKIDTPPSVMPAYNGRVLAYLTSSITMAVGVLEGHFHDYLIWFIPAAMLWPHLLYFVIRHLKLEQSAAARENTLLIDGALVGVIIVLIDFSPTATIFNILMASFSFIVVGGMSTWLKGNLILLTSTIISSMIFGLDFAPHAPMIVDLVAGISATVYVSVTAYYTHQQAEALHKAKHQIQTQREQSISLSHKLAKYLSPQVWQSIFTGERDVRLETQRKRLSIFFSDIKGFTELSEEMEPEGLTE
ncbi:diguanylate cyclase AdrA, partial [Oleiphilus sp. HI0086]